MGSFITCTLRKYNWNDQVKEDEIAGHVARMGIRRMRIGFSWESQRKRDQKEYLDVGGRIIINESQRDKMGWYGLYSSVPRQEPVADSHEHDNEPSGSI
jgi:hypothetical protein